VYTIVGALVYTIVGALVYTIVGALVYTIVGALVNTIVGALVVHHSWWLLNSSYLPDVSASLHLSFRSSPFHPFHHFVIFPPSLP
jgi:hypothetical protein